MKILHSVVMYLYDLGDVLISLTPAKDRPSVRL